MKVIGAEALMMCLVHENVDKVFGYPGGAIMPIYDKQELYREKIKHILFSHEQGAIHAAEAYARISKKTGVCFATSGPGATNLITGLADAMMDSTPLVCITGQVSNELTGTDAFQETDIVGLSMGVTKWNAQIRNAQEIPKMISKAFYIAQTGRPGPVLIDITKDAQKGELDFFYKKTDFLRSYKLKKSINSEQIIQAAKIINHAQKPLLIFGQGISISGAEKELKRLVEKASIPTASTLLGLSVMNTSHPLYMGMLGMHGNYAPNMLTNQCDVLIAIGMRFDDRVTGELSKYAKQAKIIHIDIDPAEIDKNVAVHLGISADAKLALSHLIPLLSSAKRENWIKKFNFYGEIEHDKVISQDLFPSNPEISMAEAVNLCSEMSHGKAIIVTDVGQHQMVAARYSQFCQPKSFITSGGLGTMGFGLPAAIGAKIASPEREVILFVGDGGFQMTIQELGTIFRYQIPLKIVLLNNHHLGMVRQWQEMFFNARYASTPMKNPNYQLIANGYFIDSMNVSERKDLKNGITRMLETKNSFILEIQVENMGKVLPMIPPGAAVTEMILE